MALNSSVQDHAPRGPLPALLTVQQLAEYLRVPVSTIYWWRSEARGPRGFKVGKQLRFRASDVVAWLEQQSADPDHGQTTRQFNAEIAALLGDGVWRTAAEIAEKGKGGIGCRRADVEACLEGNAHLFVAIKGPKVGRSPKAVCWQLRQNENHDSQSRSAGLSAVSDDAAHHDGGGREG